MSDLRDVYQMACPNCGNAKELVVRIAVEAALTVWGTCADGDHEWFADSPCACPHCLHNGLVSDFTIDTSLSAKEGDISC